MLLQITFEHSWTGHASRAGCCKQRSTHACMYVRLYACKRVYACMAVRMCVCMCVGRGYETVTLYFLCNVQILCYVVLWLLCHVVLHCSTSSLQSHGYCCGLVLHSTAHLCICAFTHSCMHTCVYSVLCVCVSSYVYLSMFAWFHVYRHACSSLYLSV